MQAPLCCPSGVAPAPFTVGCINLLLAAKKVVNILIRIDGVVGGDGWMKDDTIGDVEALAQLGIVPTARK